MPLILGGYLAAAEGTLPGGSLVKAATVNVWQPFPPLGECELSPTIGKNILKCFGLFGGNLLDQMLCS